MMYTEIKGDLIRLAYQFDVVAHGCNCFCVMGSGIAPQMAKAFGADKFKMESEVHKGDINKLGTIDWQPVGILKVKVVNCYTQYSTGGVALDYEALILCLRKMNHEFSGSRIGLPQIGCGLAGGDWTRVKEIIQRELKDCDVTVVIYQV